jgi:hypothetical protein
MLPATTTDGGPIVRTTHRPLVAAVLAGSLALLGLAGLAGCGDDDDPPVDTVPRVPSVSAPGPGRPHDGALPGSLAASLAKVPEVVPKDAVSDARGASGGGATRSGQVADAKCFARTQPADPDKVDQSTGVDCAELHAAEVYASIPMDSWPAELDAYTTSGETHDKWVQWAWSQCGQRLQHVTGADQIAATLGLADSYVSPDADLGYTIWIPEYAWTHGDRRTDCVAYAYDGIRAAGEWVPTLLSAARPEIFPSCVAADGDDYLYVPCSQRHFREFTFYFNVRDVLGQDFVDGVDPDTITDEQYAAMDQLCGGTESQLLGRERDDLKVYSLTSSYLWPVGETDRYLVRCEIVPEHLGDGQEVAGAAIGIGDGQLQFFEPGA